MKRYAELALLRNKLEIVLFINQFFYYHDYTSKELPNILEVLHDELNELAKIYESTKDFLEECI